MKKYKVPKTYSKESFRIPLCAECGEELRKFRGKWVCKDCMKLPVRGDFGKIEQVPFGEIYMNRAQRRTK